jgi:menaquinone-dependent protoporphyrinogen oxidase
MGNRILITYASKSGSTTGVAERIGAVLSGRGQAVDVLPLGKVSDLSPYQTVILGSAIRMGRPLPEAVTFVEKNQATLKQKAFSTFFVCLTLKDDTEENRKTVEIYPEPLRTLVKPEREAIFAGALIPEKLGLVERLMMKAMKSPAGDYRNWDAVKTWAESLPVV